MSIQTLKYNNGLSPVAIDSEGNLVTDSVGNVVIPIQPLSIGASTGVPIGDIELTGCKYVTISLPDKTVSFARCAGETITNSLGIYDGRLLDLNMRALNEEYGDVVSFDVSVSLDFTRVWKEITTSDDGMITYCSAYTPFEHGLHINWGSNWLSARSVPTCGGDVHIGKVTIDFESATVTIDDSRVPQQGVGSDINCLACITEPGPYDIEVVANYRFCLPFISENGEVVLISDTVYADDLTVDSGLIWRRHHNDVTVDVGETEKEAKEKAAITKVAATETRQFITCDNHSGTFWRDVSKDATLGGSKYVGHVYYTPSWDEYARGFPGSFVPLSIERLDDICGVKLYFTPDDGDYPGSVFSGTILTDVFDSDSIPADATPEEALDLFLTKASGILTLIPKYDNTDGEVFVSSDAADIGEYGATGLLQRGTGTKHYAWTLSPCHQLDAEVITVYTASENPAWGVAYYTDTESSAASGTVTSDDREGTYSITGENGRTYYYSGYVGEVADEEFE